MATKTPVAPTRYDTERTLPRLAQAVSLAFAVMDAGKAVKWEDLNSVLPMNIDLADDQIDLLRENEQTLVLLRYGVRDKSINAQGVKTTPIVVCPVCERWMMVGTTAPASCKMTLGCPGKPVKVSAAKKMEPDAERMPLTTPDRTENHATPEQLGPDDLAAAAITRDAPLPPKTERSSRSSSSRDDDDYIDPEARDYDPGMDFGFDPPDDEPTTPPVVTDEPELEPELPPEVSAPTEDAESTQRTSGDPRFDDFFEAPGPGELDSRAEPADEPEPDVDEATPSEAEPEPDVEPEPEPEPEPEVVTPEEDHQPDARPARPVMAGFASDDFN